MAPSNVHVGAYPLGVTGDQVPGPSLPNSPRNSIHAYRATYPTNNAARLASAPRNNIFDAASMAETLSDHNGDLEHNAVGKKGEASHDDAYGVNRPKLKWKQRLHHFTWAWFTFPMSTGGLSLLIHAQPHQFKGLREIGTVVYAVNLAIFSFVVTCIFTRFFLHRGDFTRSLSHPREGFFFPTFFLATATIITSTHRYAIPADDPTLNWAIQATYWLYVIATLALAAGQYSYVFASHSFGLQTMMPTWILPIFPIMLSGTIASVIAATQPEIAAVPVIVAGLTCQGLGISVSFLMYAHMVGRLMQSGLPNREHRPGLFMCVGPPAFTALALIGMANNLPENFDPNGDGLGEKAMIRVLAIIAGGFLWALSLWWFFIALIAVVRSPPRYFHLGWWAMVFPNTGFILATISLGNAFKSEAVLFFANGASVVLLITYFYVLYHNIKAVIKQDIMYPGRDEDVEDH
ncbi:hypothetical protein RB594_007987 [Gaeumannomyces avenae]